MSKIISKKVSDSNTLFIGTRLIILNLNQIGAAADVDHIVSNKILQKAGLKFVDTFTFDNSLCNWYNLKKEDYFK